MSLMAASLLGGCASDNLKISPVNPDASQEARQLLEFLYSIRGRYTLAGQHNFISDPGRYDSVVFAMTGKHPVVWEAISVSMHKATTSATTTTAAR